MTGSGSMRRSAPLPKEMTHDRPHRPIRVGRAPRGATAHNGPSSSPRSGRSSPMPSRHGTGNRHRAPRRPSGPHWPSSAIRACWPPATPSSRSTSSARPGSPSGSVSLTLLLPIIVPIVSAVVLTANLLSGNTVGQAITAGIGTAVTVTLQILFWVTLVFAIIERAANVESITGKAWTVDDLPELPDDGRISVVDAVSTVIANVVVVVGDPVGAAAATDRRRRTGIPAVRPVPVVVLAAVLHRRLAGGDRIHHRALHARPLDVGVRRHQCRPRRRVRHPGRLAAPERPAAQSGPRLRGRGGDRWHVAGCDRHRDRRDRRGHRCVRMPSTASARRRRSRR